MNAGITESADHRTARRALEKDVSNILLTQLADHLAHHLFWSFKREQDGMKRAAQDTCERAGLPNFQQPTEIQGMCVMQSYSRTFAL